MLEKLRIRLKIILKNIVCCKNCHSECCSIEIDEHVSNYTKSKSISPTDSPIENVSEVSG